MKASFDLSDSNTRAILIASEKTLLATRKIIKSLLLLSYKYINFGGNTSDFDSLHLDLHFYLKEIIFFISFRLFL